METWPRLLILFLVLTHPMALSWFAASAAAPSPGEPFVMELAPGAVAASILDGYVTVVYRGVVEFYGVSSPGGPAVNLSAYYGLSATIYSADACPSRGLVVVAGFLVTTRDSLPLCLLGVFRPASL